MKRLVFIGMFSCLGHFLKAQTWAPLDTGYFDVWQPWGLSADTANGNLFTFGQNVNVYHNSNLEYWYSPYLLYNNSNYPIIQYHNKKNLLLKNYLENNNVSKPRTALVRFSNATDLDTLLTLIGDWTNGGYTYYNGKLEIVLGSTAGATVSYNGLAEFDGTSFTPIGKPTWGVSEGVPQVCATYNGELYAAGDIDSSLQVLKQNVWKKVYPGIHGSNKSISKLLVYNNRLYVIGGFWKFENPNNPGNSIAAWDGVKWDDLGGGGKNDIIPLNGGFDDAVVCNGKLYVVGYGFTSVSGVKAKYIASWNDTTWCALTTNIDSLGSQWRIECLKDTIYTYGSFPKQNNKDIGKIGKLLKMNFTDTCSDWLLAEVKSYPTSNIFKVYPNPVSENLHLLLDGYSETGIEIEIINYLGQIVFKKPFRKEIDVSELPQGFYCIKTITASKIEINSKFIKN